MFRILGKFSFSTSTSGTKELVVPDLPPIVVDVVAQQPHRVCVGDEIDALGERLPEQPGRPGAAVPIRGSARHRNRSGRPPTRRIFRRQSVDTSLRRPLHHARRAARASFAPMRPASLAVIGTCGSDGLEKWSISSPGIASVQVSFEPSLGLTKSFDQPATHLDAVAMSCHPGVDVRLLFPQPLRPLRIFGNAASCTFPVFLGGAIRSPLRRRPSVPERPFPGSCFGYGSAAQRMSRRTNADGDR